MQAIPKAYLDVEQAVIHARQTQQLPVSFEQFAELCHQHGVEDQDPRNPVGARLVLFLLSRWGTLLHYKVHQGTRDWIVYHPQWLADVLRCVISVNIRSGDDPLFGHASIKQVDKKEYTGQGIVSRPILARLWKEEQYPESIHADLVDLMVQFELCFPLDQVRGRILVPRLLRSDLPQDGSASFPGQTVSLVRLVSPLLSRDNFFHRFMFRMHMFVGGEAGASGSGGGGRWVYRT